MTALKSRADKTTLNVWILAASAQRDRRGQQKLAPSQTGAFNVAGIFKQGSRKRLCRTLSAAAPMRLKPAASNLLVQVWTEFRSAGSAERQPARCRALHGVRNRGGIIVFPTPARSCKQVPGSTSDSQVLAHATCQMENQTTAAVFASLKIATRRATARLGRAG